MAAPRSLFLLLAAAAAAAVVAAFSAGGSSQPSSPAPWPEVFHALLYTNLTKTGKLQIINLYYDWPRQRNMNLIQSQLGNLLYDVEWGNKSSFYFTKGKDGYCTPRTFPVGILTPDWLAGAEYLGRRNTSGFECHLWTKVDFIWYYEDVVTRRPVRWDFYTGMTQHVMTFEVGVVLEDSEWQAPAYCFTNGSSSSYGVENDKYADVLLELHEVTDELNMLRSV